MSLSQGDLVFYVNSTAQGVAATGVPRGVYAVVDLYGKCVQATIVGTRPVAHRIVDHAADSSKKNRQTNKNKNNKMDGTWNPFWSVWIDSKFGR